MKQANRLIWLFRILLLSVVAAFILYYLLHREAFTIEAIVNMVPGDFLLAFGVILLLYAMKSLSVVFPLMVLQISVGLIYPPLLGILVNTAGALVMISLPYWVFRKLSPDGISHFYQKYPKLEPLIARHADNELLLSFLMRILGFLPIDILSMLLGTMHVSYGKYLLGSLAGLFPGILASTLLGDAILDPASPQFLLSLASVALISLVSFAIYLKTLKKDKEKKGPNT